MGVVRRKPLLPEVGKGLAKLAHCQSGAHLWADGRTTNYSSLSMCESYTRLRNLFVTQCLTTRWRFWVYGGLQAGVAEVVSCLRHVSIASKARLTRTSRHESPRMGAITHGMRQRHDAACAHRGSPTSVYNCSHPPQSFSTDSRNLWKLFVSIYELCN